MQTTTLKTNSSLHLQNNRTMKSVTTLSSSCPTESAKQSELRHRLIVVIRLKIAEYAARHQYWREQYRIVQLRMNTFPDNILYWQETFDIEMKEAREEAKKAIDQYNGAQTNMYRLQLDLKQETERQEQVKAEAIAHPKEPSITPLHSLDVIYEYEEEE